jgi:hypothetical protein
MTHTLFMLDTTVFNHMKDKGVPIAVFLGRRMFATHVQLDELGRTPDPAKKAELLQIFAEIAPDRLATETSIWGDTNWDEGKWSADDGLYEKLLQRIRELDKKPRPLNQSRDARIAETAIKNGLTLITDDPRLRKAAVEHGGKVMTLAEFIELASPGLQ